MTGMHRSGTSFVASLLLAAGVHMGERLMEGSRGNERGHFENLDFVEFQERMLRSIGYDEAGLLAAGPAAIEADSFSDDAYAEAREILAANAREGPWGWKDPRCTLLLDFWARVSPGAFYVLLYREPAEVLDSLFRRGDATLATTPEAAARAWLAYNETLLRFTRMNRARCVLANSAVVARNPEGFLSIVASRFSIEVDTRAPSTYDPDLSHQMAPERVEPVLLRYLLPETERLFVDLEGEADLAAGVYRDSPVSSKRARAVFFENWAAERRSAGAAVTTEGRETAELEALLLERESELCEARTLLATADAEMRRAQGAFNEQTARTTAAAEQLAALQAGAHVTQLELVRTQEQLQAARSERDGALIRLDERIASLARAELRVVEHTERFHQAEVELAKMSAQLHIAQHERDAFSERMVESERRSGELAAELIGTNDRLRAVQAEFEAEMLRARTFVAQAAQTQRRADDLVRELDAANSRVKELHVHVATIEERSGAAIAEAASTRTELLGWLDQLEGVTQTLAAEREATVTLRSQFETELAESQVRHDAEIESARTRINALANELENMRAEYEVASESFASALEETREREASLRAALAEVRTANAMQNEAVAAEQQRAAAVAAELKESLERELAVRTELEALRVQHRVTHKTLEETSLRFLEHVNVSLSRTREEAQQIAGMIDEIQSSRFWAFKRTVSRLLGRSDTRR
ncbi:MAG TPA: hypothetical protein VMF11_00905 [Candidatus Baltobacteraceae bacterium]|nr:hypothetical protein [Candidatus Baltobacteraceae bacterium]